MRKLVLPLLAVAMVAAALLVWGMGAGSNEGHLLERARTDEAAASSGPELHGSAVERVAGEEDPDLRPAGGDDPTRVSSRGPFRGIVVGPDGKPLGGADVRVVHALAEEGAPEGLSSIGIKSEPDGGFEITLEEPVQNISVVAHSVDRLLASPVTGLELESRVEVKLEAVHPLRVQVIDSESRPVSGVAVRMLEGEQVWEIGLDLRSPFHDEATTDKSGQAALASLGGRGVVWVMPLIGPAFAKAEFPRVPPAGADLTLEMPGTGVYAGTVRDPMGSPVAGARVEVDRHTYFHLGGAAVLHGTTDSEGRFRVGGVESRSRSDGTPGPVTVAVSVDGWPRTEVVAPAPAVGETRQVDLVLLPWRRVSGLVLLPEGAPARSAALHQAYGTGSADYQTVLGRTDEGGRFTLDEVHPAWDGLVAVVEVDGRRLVGRQQFEEGVAYNDVSIVVAEEPPARGVDPLHLPPESQTRLHIRDAEHRPSPWPTLVVCARHRGVGEPGFKYVDEVRGDENGEVVLPRLEDSELVVLVRTGSSAPFVLVIPAGARDVTIDVPQGRISGTLTDLDGKAMSGSLQFRMVSHPETRRLFDFLLTRWGIRVEAGEDGRFVIDGVGPGEYDFEEMYSARLLLDPRHRYRAGDTNIRLVRVSRIEGEALRLSGTWVDAVSGDPVPDASGWLTVHPLDEPTRVQEVRFSAERAVRGGTRAQEPLAPGTYRGVLRVVGFEPIDVPAFQIPASGELPRLDARVSRATGRLRGTVRIGDGLPVPRGAWIRAQGRRVEVGTDGSFAMEIPTFPRAAGTVSLLGDFVQRVDQRVTFDEAGAADLHLTAQRSGALRVRVPAGLEPRFRVVLSAHRVDSGGHVDPNASVTLEIDRDAVVRRGPEHTWGGIPPSIYEIRVAWDGAEWPSTKVEVKEAQFGDLELRPR